MCLYEMDADAGAVAGAVQAGILTVEGCLGDEGQESESGELCLGAGAHSYQQEARHDECLITTG